MQEAAAQERVACWIRSNLCCGDWAGGFCQHSTRNTPLSVLVEQATQTARRLVGSALHVPWQDVALQVTRCEVAHGPHHDYEWFVLHLDDDSVAEQAIQDIMELERRQLRMRLTFTGQPAAALRAPAAPAADAGLNAARGAVSEAVHRPLSALQLAAGAGAPVAGEGDSEGGEGGGEAEEERIVQAEGAGGRRHQVAARRGRRQRQLQQQEQPVIVNHNYYLIPQGMPGAGHGREVAGSPEPRAPAGVFGGAAGLLVAQPVAGAATQQPVQPPQRQPSDSQVQNNNLQLAQAGAVHEGGSVGGAGEGGGRGQGGQRAAGRQLRVAAQGTGSVAQPAAQRKRRMPLEEEGAEAAQGQQPVLQSVGGKSKKRRCKKRQKQDTASQQQMSGKQASREPEPAHEALQAQATAGIQSRSRKYITTKMKKLRNRLAKAQKQLAEQTQWGGREDISFLTGTIAFMENKLAELQQQQQLIDTGQQRGTTCSQASRPAVENVEDSTGTCKATNQPSAPAAAPAPSQSKQATGHAAGNKQKRPLQHGAEQAPVTTQHSGEQAEQAARAELPAAATQPSIGLQHTPAPSSNDEEHHADRDTEMAWQAAGQLTQQLNGGLQAATSKQPDQQADQQADQQPDQQAAASREAAGQVAQAPHSQLEAEQQAPACVLQLTSQAWQHLVPAEASAQPLKLPVNPTKQPACLRSDKVVVVCKDKRGVYDAHEGQVTCYCDACVAYAFQRVCDAHPDRTPSLLTAQLNHGGVKGGQLKALLARLPVGTCKQFFGHAGHITGSWSTTVLVPWLQDEDGKPVSLGSWCRSNDHKIARNKRHRSESEPKELQGFAADAHTLNTHETGFSHKLVKGAVSARPQKQGPAQGLADAAAPNQGVAVSAGHTPGHTVNHTPLDAAVAAPATGRPLTTKQQRKLEKQLKAAARQAGTRATPHASARAVDDLAAAPVQTQQQQCLDTALPPSSQQAPQDAVVDEAEAGAAKAAKKGAKKLAGQQPAAAAAAAMEADDAVADLQQEAEGAGKRKKKKEKKKKKKRVLEEQEQEGGQDGDAGVTSQEQVAVELKTGSEQPQAGDAAEGGVERRPTKKQKRAAAQAAEREQVERAAEAAGSGLVGVVVGGKTGRSIGKEDGGQHADGGSAHIQATQAEVSKKVDNPIGKGKLKAAASQSTSDVAAEHSNSSSRQQQTPLASESGSGDKSSSHQTGSSSKGNKRNKSVSNKSGSERGTASEPATSISKGSGDKAGSTSKSGSESEKAVSSDDGSGREVSSSGKEGQATSGTSSERKASSSNSEQAVSSNSGSGKDTSSSSSEEQAASASSREQAADSSSSKEVTSNSSGKKASSSSSDKGPSRSSSSEQKASSSSSDSEHQSTSEARSSSQATSSSDKQESLSSSEGVNKSDSESEEASKGRSGSRSSSGDTSKSESESEASSSRSGSKEASSGDSGNSRRGKQAKHKAGVLQVAPSQQLQAVLNEHAEGGSAIEALLRAQLGLGLEDVEEEEPQQPDTQPAKDEEGQVDIKSDASAQVTAATKSAPSKATANKSKSKAKPAEHKTEVQATSAAGDASELLSLLTLDAKTALPKTVGPLRKMLSHHLREYITVTRLQCNKGSVMGVMRYNLEDKPSWWPETLEYSAKCVNNSPRDVTEDLMKRLRAAMMTLRQELKQRVDAEK